jgi:AcrR family transcriptional regulator
VKNESKRAPKADPAIPAKPPSKGEVSRDAILGAAARLATLKGLDGLSIGDLAAAVGMSKSGLYAHFKSKEDLELATIDAATVIFAREVMEPGLAAPAGLRRLRALTDAFLSHLERRVFPGGCFFASVAMELDTRPGPLRDRVAATADAWLALLRRCLLEARAAGEVATTFDPDQAVFEIEAMLLAANFLFVLTGAPESLAKSRRGVDHVLARLAPVLKPRSKRPRA